MKENTGICAKKQRRNGEIYENCILTLLIVTLNLLLMAACFDFYYDLNDDTMMLDIMSGAYSGVPDGHNMQTLYPLGALIALCYRMCGTIPWYGLFLCLCQFGCLCLVGVRLCGLAGKGWEGKAGKKGRGGALAGKIAVLLLLSLFVWGVCLSHLVHIQYTVTAAILSAAAVFLFLTAPETDGVRQFLIGNIPAMALVVIAYQLRSEMLLLTFPFICLAGFCRLTGEKKIFAKENLQKYGGVLGIMLAGMLLSRGVDYAAYGSGEWKDFLHFFEARTTVYDFYPELTTGEEYADALTRLGVAPHQRTLLRNYNYGLDDAVDTELFMKMADYATDTLRREKDWGAIVRRQAYRYFYRTFRGGDSPYSTLLLWMYAAVIAAGFCVRPGRAGQEENGAVKSGLLRRYAFLWQLVLLIAGRSTVWMFILLRGRDPERITHSLYLVEFALLAGMMQRSLNRNIRLMRRVRGGMAAVFLLLAVNGVISGVPSLREEQAAREAVNRNWHAIDEYCRAHEENFYFEDVYSTVSFSRRIFEPAGYGYANYDILGGWMCGSPLYYDKIGRYGIASAAQALVGQDNVYLILSDREAAEQGFGWIVDYYDAKGVRVLVEKTDTVGEGYCVYRVVRAA